MHEFFFLLWNDRTSFFPVKWDVDNTVHLSSFLVLAFFLHTSSSSSAEPLPPPDLDFFHFPSCGNRVSVYSWAERLFFVKIWVCSSFVRTWTVNMTLSPQPGVLWHWWLRLRWAGFIWTETLQVPFEPWWWRQTHCVFVLSVFHHAGGCPGLVAINTMIVPSSVMWNSSASDWCETGWQAEGRTAPDLEVLVSRKEWCFRLLIGRAWQILGGRRKCNAGGMGVGGGGNMGERWKTSLHWFL